MNAADIEKSDRLRRVAALLADGREYSTRDIVQLAHVCAVNSVIAELRENGYEIVCRRDGRERFVYRLVAVC